MRVERRITQIRYNQSISLSHIQIEIILVNSCVNVKKIMMYTSIWGDAALEKLICKYF